RPRRSRGGSRPRFGSRRLRGRTSAPEDRRGGDREDRASHPRRHWATGALEALAPPAEESESDPPAPPQMFSIAWLPLWPDCVVVRAIRRRKMYEPAGGAGATAMEIRCVSGAELDTPAIVTCLPKSSFAAAHVPRFCGCTVSLTNGTSPVA